MHDRAFPGHIRSRREALHLTQAERLDELPFDRRVIHKLQQACRYRAERLAAK